MSIKEALSESRLLDGEGMLEEWKTSVAPIFEKKGDVVDCGGIAYTGVKLLEHAMKREERVLENSKRI